MRFETEWMDLEPYPGPPEKRYWIDPVSSTGSVIRAKPGTVRVGDIWFDNRNQPVGVIVSIDPVTDIVAVAFDGTFRRR